MCWRYRALIIQIFILGIFKFQWDFCSLYVNVPTDVSIVLLFWLAFVLTRPFGATFGDLLTKTHEKGGLDLGTVGSSLFRKRIGQVGVDIIFGSSVTLHLEAAEEERVIIDTTAHEKNVTYPTDGKLAIKIIP